MIYFIGQTVLYTDIYNSSIEALKQYFSDKAEISFDTETEGFDPYSDKLLTYQLGDNKNQFVVDAKLYPIELIKGLLEEKELLIHNAKFDLKFLYHQNIYPTKIWDTYLGECVLHKGDKTVRKSLEATLYRYFKVKLNKTIKGKIFREKFSERVIKYCAEDVQYLGDTKEVQYKNLERQDLINSMQLENLFVKVLTYIEYSGIYLDKHMWIKKIQQDQQNFLNSVNQLNDWVLEHNMLKYIDTQLSLFDNIKRVNILWSSSKQVVGLFKDLGIDTQITDDKTGELKDSVEAGVIEKQLTKSTILPIYLTYKKYEKVISTYGESVLTKINPITGRIHTSFTQVMNTGRLSSGGFSGDKETINLQNIPKLPDCKDPNKIYERECFTCEPGNILVNADYSGQEQIVFANWTLDKDLLDFYKQDLGDMHAFIASKIFPELKDVPLKEIKSKHKDKRQIAKAAGFAMNYGGDGSTIADNLNLSREEGDAIYKAYFDAFPGVSDYFKKVTNQALKTGYILFNPISKSKCFIHFFDQFKDIESRVNKPVFWEKYREEKLQDSILFNTELKPLVSKYFKMRGNISRMAINYGIQGSSAEITKLACIFIFNHIVKNNLQKVVKFSNVIHDKQTCCV